jgi:hypothetical protein
MRLAIFVGSTFGFLFCRPVIAQEQSEQPSTQTQTTANPNAASSVPDKDWHFAITPYLWFAGVHGTAGAFGHDASVHASPGDLLKHLDFGILGASEALSAERRSAMDEAFRQQGAAHCDPGNGIG